MRRWLIVAAMVAATTFPARAADPVPTHAFATWGEPKYGPDFKHFDYVNPNAPKGGTVRLGAMGSFDSLNPFILKGAKPAGIGGLFDTLLVGDADELSVAYGLLAKTITVAPDRSWAEFELRPEARFHDGSQVTAEDIVFSFNILKEKGNPEYAVLWADVSKAEVTQPGHVRFTFTNTENRELPLIVGQVPALSRAYYAKVPFDQTSFDPPMGSGPHLVEKVDPGRSIIYKRDPGYWGRDLPVTVGQDNFDRLRYEYYRDPTVLLEALKAGDLDFREENSAKSWATAYDSPALQQKQLIKLELPDGTPGSMQGWVLNLRKPLFQDRRVRQALSYAYDFEWTNKTLAYGAYTRIRSYFGKGPFEATGVPSGDELAVLEPFRDKLPAELFTTEYQPPKTDGTGNMRDNLKAALKLFAEAGWTINKDGKLVNAKGEQFAFEFLSYDQRDDRLLQPLTRNLERLGIAARTHLVDPPQFERLTNVYDFDVIGVRLSPVTMPGNEQRDFWTCASAKVEGGSNYHGVCDPVIDALVELVVHAPDLPSLTARTRALDRVLQWGFYTIPQFTIDIHRLAMWDMFGRPAVVPRYELAFGAWWIEPDRIPKLTLRRGG